MKFKSDEYIPLRLFLARYRKPIPPHQISEDCTGDSLSPAVPAIRDGGTVPERLARRPPAGEDGSRFAKEARPDGLEVTFAYDALGRRLWKKAGRATTRFVWDGDVLLHEWKSVEGRAPDPDDVVTWLFEP
ncbi:MAG: hypothetical protein RLZZ165_345, partial [Bacteroidota bacterium]